MGADKDDGEGDDFKDRQRDERARARIAEAAGEPVRHFAESVRGREDLDEGDRRRSQGIEDDAGEERAQRAHAARHSGRAVDNGCGGERADERREGGGRFAKGGRAQSGDRSGQVAAGRGEEESE